LGNVQVKSDSVVVTVNPKLYPIEAVYSASYVFLENAYLLLDGDPKKEIKVTLKMKEGKASLQELEKLGHEFANELINYSDYRERAKSTKQIREMLMQRALFTNDPQAFSQGDDFDEEEFNKLMKELEDDESSELDDPEIKIFSKSVTEGIHLIYP